MPQRLCLSSALFLLEMMSYHFALAMLSSYRTQSPITCAVAMLSSYRTQSPITCAVAMLSSYRTQSPIT